MPGGRGDDTSPDGSLALFLQPHRLQAAVLSQSKPEGPMRCSASSLSWLRGVALLVVPLLVSTCSHSDDGSRGADTDRGGGTGPAFLQPTGLAIAEGRSGEGGLEAVIVHAAATDRPDQVLSFELGSPPGGSTLSQAVITSVDPIAAKPFAPMRLTGSGFTLEPGAAVSVLFEAPGVTPVAVPAGRIEADGIDFAAPLLFDASGRDVGGYATVRVVQVLGEEATVSAPFVGVELTPLPQPEGETPRPGLLTAMLLDSAEQAVIVSLGSSAEMLPAPYRAEALALQGDLRLLARAVRDAAEGVADPEPLPWSGDSPPALDSETLAFADRLSLTVMNHIVAAMRRDVEESASEVGLVRLTQSVCGDLMGTPEQQMESLLCQRSEYGERLVDLGSRGVALGFQVEASVFAGFWGGAGAAILGNASKQLALGFEVVWAGLTGHLTSWMTGQQRPSAGQTLADSGATLLDRTLATHGVIDTMWSMISFGRQYDALIREAAASGGSGGGGADVGPDSADARSDAGDVHEEDGAPGDGVFAGTAWLHGSFSDERCLYDATLSLSARIDGFSGRGDPVSPYAGNARVEGTFSGTPVAPNPRCEAGSVALVASEGRVSGAAGHVVFETLSESPPRYELTFRDGEVSGDTISGWVVVDFLPEGVYWFSVEGALTLHSQ